MGRGTGQGGGWAPTMTATGTPAFAPARKEVILRTSEQCATPHPISRDQYPCTHTMVAAAASIAGPRVAFRSAAAARSCRRSVRVQAAALVLPDNVTKVRGPPPPLHLQLHGGAVHVAAAAARPGGCGFRTPPRPVQGIRTSSPSMYFAPPLHHLIRIPDTQPLPFTATPETALPSLPCLHPPSPTARPPPARPLPASACRPCCR